LLGGLALASVPSAAVAAGQSGTTRVVIIGPNSIVKTADLDYGFMIPATGGTVQIQAQTGARSVVAGAAVLAGGTPGPARFVATGTPLLILTLSVNPSPTITLNRVGGGANMTMNRIRLSINNGNEQPVGPNIILGLLGTVNIAMGGRLAVSNAQMEGLYVGNFTLTTNYQ
jgi:Domain of unknown function (DUF4402)